MLTLVFSLIHWKFPMMFIQHSVNHDWLFNTQSTVLQADWFMLEINEMATLNISMRYLAMTMFRYCDVLSLWNTFITT